MVINGRVRLQLGEAVIKGSYELATSGATVLRGRGEGIQHLEVTYPDTWLTSLAHLCGAVPPWAFPTTPKSP